MRSGRQAALAPTAPAEMTPRPRRADADGLQVGLKVGSAVGLISEWKLSVSERFPPPLAAASPLALRQHKSAGTTYRLR